MLLVVDIGNTHTVIGVYQGESLIAHWRLASVKDRTEDEFGILLTSLFSRKDLDASNVNHAVIGSVVPPLTGAWMRAVEDYFHTQPLLVGPGIKTGIRLKFDNPREIGADRIANAVGAHAQYGGPIIVVDFGTATTFDFIDAEGSYVGGLIAPGIRVAADALFERASKLPKIELEYPEHVLGRNTVESMQSGIMYGYACLVDGLIERLRKETGAEARVIATGGLAQTVARYAHHIEKVDEWVTLEGLRLIYLRNRSGSV